MAHAQDGRWPGLNLLQSEVPTYERKVETLR